MTHPVLPVVASLALAAACGAAGASQPAAAPAGTTDPTVPNGTESLAEDSSPQGWHALTLLPEDAGVNKPEAKVDVSFAASYVGKHPAYLMDALAANPGVDTRLRKLLGSDFDEWRARFVVASQVERSAGLLVAEGCMAHLCGGARLSMIVIDVTKNVIAVGMVTDGKADARSEDGQIPPPLKTWVGEFSTP